MNTNEVFDFLVSHPDWSPYIAYTADGVHVSGFYGPTHIDCESGSFYPFADIQRVMDAR